MALAMDVASRSCSDSYRCRTYYSDSMRIICGGSTTEPSCGDAVQRAAHRRLLRLMGRQHHRHRFARRARPLDHGLQRDLLVAQRGGDIGDDARLVDHHEANVIGAAMARHAARPAGASARWPAPRRSAGCARARYRSDRRRRPRRSARRPHPAPRRCSGRRNRLRSRRRCRRPRHGRWACPAAPCRHGRAARCRTRSAARCPAA